MLVAGRRAGSLPNSRRVCPSSTRTGKLPDWFGFLRSARRVSKRAAESPFHVHSEKFGERNLL